MTNYSRELRIEADIRRKEKVEKMIDVKNEGSGLNIFLFSSLIFIFIFDLFSFILFLELGLGLE